MEDQFAGFTNRDCPALKSVDPCDGKLRRLKQIQVRPFRGGIKVIIVFNIDEVESIEAKRRDIEEQMWDAYRALYTSPAAGSIVDANMTANARHSARGGEIGVMYRDTMGNFTIIYKTRLAPDRAATIDWDTPPSEFTTCIVFDAGGSRCSSDVWDIATLHKDYRFDVPPATEP